MGNFRMVSFIQPAFDYVYYVLGFPVGSVVKNWATNAGGPRDVGSIPLGQEDPLEEEMAITSSILV